MFNKTTWKLGDTGVDRKWYLIDAAGKPLGRVASVAAVYLAGKNRADYVPNMDLGNFVVIVNIEKVVLSGRKMEYKELVSYSGYPSGLKRRRVKDLFKTNPKKVLLHAIKGMLPKNKLTQNFLNRLKLYVGPEHKHQAQQPEEIKL